MAMIPLLLDSLSLFVTRSCKLQMSMTSESREDGGKEREPVFLDLHKEATFPSVTSRPTNRRGEKRHTNLNGTNNGKINLQAYCFTVVTGFSIFPHTRAYKASLNFTFSSPRDKRQQAKSNGASKVCSLNNKSKRFKWTDLLVKKRPSPPDCVLLNAVCATHIILMTVESHVSTCPLDASKTKSRK